jgi:hypothetical protein
MKKNLKLAASAGEERQKESLEQEVDHIEQEARMVLPGIQALFGFQLIAVFNQRFGSLPKFEQVIHLAALICTAISTLCVLTPAAYHRLAQEGEISRSFTKLGTWFLGLGMFPLMTGICLDLYIISRMITELKSVSLLIALALFGCFLTAWFLYPSSQKTRRFQSLL